MKEFEGPFRLVALVGKNLDKPGRWNAAAFIRAPGESRALECLFVGDDYETDRAARKAGIETARELARTLDPTDTLAARASKKGGG